MGTPAVEKTELNNHEFYMRRCIALALQSKQRGDSPVGAVVVQNEKVVGEGLEGGKTHNDITYHAEIEAIRQATNSLQRQDLSDCVMYTTHEPCIMCSYVIRHTRIQAIVIGIKTGEIGGFSSHFPVLADQTIKRWGMVPQIITGVLEKDCLAL